MFGASAPRPGSTVPRPGRRRPRWLLAASILIAVGLVAGCGSLRYYTQAVWGGAKLIAQRQPIDRLLERGHLTPEVRERLETVLDIRDFATRELDLPDNRSYRTYVETGREAVAWNVVAAPALSVDPKVWCFPIAGCVSYRGYFRKARADSYAKRLRDEGMDTRVMPVTAFSTLGWFADPVVDTFLDLPDWQLAGLLFHELAHQVVYVTDDTTFNESFATTVEVEGVRRWLTQRNRRAEEGAASARLAEQATFRRLLLDLRGCLAEVYGSAAPDAEKLARKAELFERAQARGRAAIEAGELAGTYAGWFAAPLNNADVASVADYGAYVPAFQRIFGQTASFGDFYARVEELARLDVGERLTRLGVARDRPAGCAMTD